MSGFAWVTLATNDSYSLGALVLAHSLRQTGTAHQLAVLVTPGVTNAMRKNLADAFNVVEEVNLFDSKDEANLRLLKRPELGVTFTKLHCWRLTQFEKCVFLDADVLVLVNSDELFERDEFSAAPDVGWPDCFNSGVFVYKPSLETYTKLVDFALQTGSFDGGDQGLLNAYFSDWAHKDISKHLPFIYNMCSTASYSYLPAFKYYGANVKIVHFIGPAKPWLQYFDTESRKVHPSPDLQHLQDVLQKWWDIFCSLIHPKLSPDMATNQQSAESLSHPTPSSYAHPDHSSFHHSDSGGVSNRENNVYSVWDPWEEYEERVAISSANQYNNCDTIREEPIISEVPLASYSDFDTSQGSYCDNISHVNNMIPEENHASFTPQSNFINFGDRPVIEQAFSNVAHVVPTQHIPPVFNNQNQETEDYQISQPPNASIVDLTLDNFNESFNCGESSSVNDSKLPIQSYSNPDSSPLTRIITQTETLPNMCETSAINSQDASLFTKDNDDAESTSQSGLAGAFAQFTLGVKRSPSQDALENHLRRQAWEVGNIDYMGRDSFDNIWNKICQTLSSTELEAGPVKVEAVSSSASQQVPEVAKDSQETVATIAETPVTPEQSQGNVIQAEANLQVADVPTPPADISLQPISSEASKTEEEVGAPPASSEVSQQQSEVAPQPQPEAIPISEIPPQSQPEEAPLQTVPVQLESKAPLAPPQETPLQEVPQPQLEVAPIVQPEPIFVQEASQSQLETAPLAPPEVAPLQEVSQPQSEVAPIVQQEPTVVQETSQPQLETAPLAPPEAVPLEELPQPQPETTPLEATPELQPEIPIPLQEIQQTQSEIPAPVQETPQTVQEVLPTQPEIAPVQEISTVQPDVIPKTEVAPPKEESKAEIPVVQEEPTKPIEAIQQIETPQPTQLPITETPAVVEEVKVQQVENKPQEEVIVAPIQESIPPPEIPVEKPVETPILKEEPAPIKEEIPAATVKSTETKKVTQPEKVEETKKEPVAIPKKGATKSEAAKAAKEPESPKAEASVVQESAPGEASTDVPKSDTKPKETRKIKKKVKKVPKAEASGEGPEGTSKK